MGRVGPLIARWRRNDFHFFQKLVVIVNDAGLTAALFTCGAYRERILCWCGLVMRRTLLVIATDKWQGKNNMKNAAAMASIFQRLWILRQELRSLRWWPDGWLVLYSKFQAKQTGIGFANDEGLLMNDATTAPAAEEIPEDPVREAHRAMEADIERLTRSAEISRKIGRSAHRITFVLGPAAIAMVWIIEPRLVFGDEFFIATAQVAVALLIAAIVEGGLSSQRSTKLKRDLDAGAERMSEREFHAELALGRASRKVETARARLAEAEESGCGKRVRRELAVKLIQRENEAASCAARLIRIQGRGMRLRVEAAERDRQRSSVYSLVGLNIVWFLLAEGASLFALLNEGDSFLAVTATLGIWLSTATLAAFLADRLDDFESELAADDTR